jgi:predicted MPP superfamily phosphohydrolase
LNPPFELLLIAVFSLVEWRITVLLLRFARRHWTGWRLGAARAAMVLFNVLLLLGYSFSLVAVLPHFPLNPTFGMLMGALTLAYLASATVLLVVHQALSAVRRQLDAALNPGRRRALNAAGNLLMAAPFAAMGYGALVERTDFRLREIEVPVPGLPADLDGLRILQLSDIHLSAFLSEAELARVIDACRELHPHLAVVTGDLISARGDPLDACIRQLARLRSDAGTFGCMGNHEHWASAEKHAAERGARAGIRFLRGQNQALRFGQSVLNVAGVDYEPIGKPSGYLIGAERMVDPAAFNLLLSHNPDVFPKAARQGYNLMLAGHTHGGQVTVEIFEQTLNPARFFTPYVHGLYRSGAAAAYVTRGIGTVAIPARLGAPPEISLLRLRKA